MSLSEIVLLVIALLLVVLIVLVLLQRGAIVSRLSGTMGEQLETKHRAMIGDVGNKFDQVTERVGRDLTLASTGTREVIGT
ncbi:MAG: hypothetical protein ACRDAM_21675, partial [Casimicrobium sp.]